MSRELIQILKPYVKHGEFKLKHHQVQEQLERTKNIVIYGFDIESNAKAINNLKDKNIINIKTWIGTTPNRTHDMIKFHTGEFNPEQYYGYGKNIYDELFHDTIYKYMEMASRLSFYKEKTYHDMLNIYNIYFDYFCYLLMNQDIDYVLMSNLPHDGIDIILYQVAKKLNIKTVMVSQSMFKDRFFYVYDIEDYGNFNQINASNINLNFKIENKYENNYILPKNFKYDMFSLQRNSFGSFFKCIIAGIFNKKNLNKVFNFVERRSNEIPTKISKHNTKFKIFNDTISFGFNYFNRFTQRYLNYIESRRSLNQIICNNVDLTKKFIYFPLHLQPELTTSTLGDLYADQLLAIEQLSTIIPDDWFIYVKENPAQTELWRGKWWFDRLSLIKKVKVISPSYNTYTLHKNCIFVSSITGTAGWEAICGGKNTLIFGNIWYKTLPGVFTYNDKFNLNDILSYKINHSELEIKLNELLQKTATGVIDQDYAILDKNYNEEDNRVKVENFITQIIGG